MTQRVVAWMMLALCGVASADDAPRDAAARLGRELLTRYHCGSCHAIPGVPAAQGRFAVSLEGYGLRSYIAGRVQNEPVALARWIADPQSIVPGTLMPNIGVSPADARAIAAYLSQLR